MVHILSTLGFMVVSFAVQAASHFKINKAHFDAMTLTRENPILPMGMAAMVIQGVIMSLALASWKGSAVTITDGLVLSLVFGLFLLAYIGLAEPAKYSVPSIASWMKVEFAASAVQFTLFGLALGYIHKYFA